MKSLASFFELPWLLVVVFSYFAAIYNNSNQKHLETFAPFILCILAISASFILFRNYDPHRMSLFPFIRFCGIGLIGTLAVWYIWVEIGSKYLNEAALGLFVFFLIFGLLNLLTIFGLAIFELIRSKPTVSSGESLLYLKTVVVIGIAVLVITSLYSFLMNSKIGSGQAASIVNSWTARNPHLSSVKIELGDSPDEVRISVINTYGLLFWNMSPQVAHDLLKNKALAAALEKSFDRLLSRQSELGLSFPFANWRSNIEPNDFSDVLKVSTQVNVSGLTQRQWDDSLKTLNDVGENRGTIPLNWIMTGLLRQYQDSENPKAFQSASLEIAFSFLNDLDPKSLREIKNAIHVKDEAFFQEDRIHQIAENTLKPVDRPLIISSLRLIRLSLKGEQ